MYYREQNFIKIHDYGKAYGLGRFIVQDESGTRGMTIEEARQQVEAFFRERKEYVDDKCKDCKYVEILKEDHWGHCADIPCITLRRHRCTSDQCIFSGEHSREMWEVIKVIKDAKDIPCITLRRHRCTSDQCIFSGEHSREMWEAINAIQDAKVKGSLYLMVNRLQELEAQIQKGQKEGKRNNV